MGHTSTALNKLHFSDIGLSFHGEIHEKLGQIATRNQLPVTCAFIGIVFRIEATACISETAPGAIARNISTGLPAIFACQLRLRLYKCVGFRLHTICIVYAEDEEQLAIHLHPRMRLNAFIIVACLHSEASLAASASSFEIVSVDSSEGIA